jgi:hypothetical protein
MNDFYDSENMFTKFDSLLEWSTHKNADHGCGEKPGSVSLSSDELHYRQGGRFRSKNRRAPPFFTGFTSC